MSEVKISSIGEAGASDRGRQPKRSIFKRWWFWTILGVGLLVIGVVAYLGNRTEQGRSDGQNNVESLPWVKGAMTQPLQPKASKTRINLPGDIGDILPDGSSMSGFGAHVGYHIEGLDHISFPLKKGVPTKAIGGGKITRVQPQNREYMIYQDLGDGLDCVYGEIVEPLVQEGQIVEPLTPIGNPRHWGGGEDPSAPGNAEIYLNDNNLVSGIYSSNLGKAGTVRSWSIAVSPYDYLNDADKEKIIKKYTEVVLDPIKNSNKFPPWDWNPTEPYLTNKIIVHEPNKILGEWFLINKEWEENDMWKLTFTESDNEWYKGTQYHIRASENNHKMLQDGIYEVQYLSEGKGKITFIEKKFNENSNQPRHYGLFEITENVAKDSDGIYRAQMRFEYSDQPISEFSNKASTYQARGARARDLWKKI